MHKIIKLGVVVLAFVIPSLVSADIGVITQPNSATSSRTTSASTINQTLGQVHLDSVSGLQLYFSEDDTGSTIDISQINFGCSTTANLSDAGTLDCGNWSNAFFSTATPTLSNTKQLYTFNASTSIIINPLLYYRISIQASGGTGGLMTWGSASTTPDAYPQGRCTRSSGGPHQCDYNSDSTLGVRDIFFSLYGDPFELGVISPVPSWWEIVSPTTASSTDLIDYGANIYVTPDRESDILIYRVVMRRLGSDFFLPETFTEYFTGSQQITEEAEWDDTDEPGTYLLYHSIYSTVLGVPFRRIYATTTHFIVGFADPDPGTGIGDIADDVYDAISDVECTIDWTDAQSVIQCVWTFLVTTVESAISGVYAYFEQFLNALFQKFPFGYFYRIYYIWTNPVTSYTPPSIDVHYQFGDVDSIVDYTPWDYLDDGMASLYATNTSDLFWLESQGTSSESTGDMLDTIFNLIGGLMFVTYLTFRIAKFYI